MKKQPKITKQQQAILVLLYKHRFLNRIQIQSFLGHTHKRRIIIWLKDLREKKYVEWIYNPNNFIEKSKPAIYHLNTNGIRYLRQEGLYSEAALRQRRGDAKRSQTFIDHCLSVADCCLALEKQTNIDRQFTYITKTEYERDGSGYEFLDALKPDLLYTKQMHSEDDESQTNYMLEIFDSTLPRYRINKRLKDYVKFLSEGSWEAAMNNIVPPTTLFVCPTKNDMIRIKRRLRLLLSDIGDEDREAIHSKVTTADELKEIGVLGVIWEEA
jgi:hypothetical protein